MTARPVYKRSIRRIIYFFPLQLLLLHVKKNHLLLLAWVVLFGYITESLGVKYGVPYLFLYPEYYGTVGFWSHAITGFALGGFITAFNLYSYTMHGYRFPFLATIARPFLKFNVNNAVIPVLFILTYMWCAAVFQYGKEFVPPARIMLHMAGFIFGNLLFLFLALLYFTRTNTDFTKLLGKQPHAYEPDEPLVDIIGPQHDTPPVGGAQKRKATRWMREQQRTEHWKVETYLTPRLRLMLARSSSHYDRQLLRDVLWQNHINGSIFEVVLVLSFIALGAFSDMRFFAIPAGASAFLFFTIVLMVVSALFSWMKGWTGTVIILVVVVLNLVSHRTEQFLYNSHAYGLDYEVPPAVYDQPTIVALATDADAMERDVASMLGTLDRWKERNSTLPHGEAKPPMLVINTSGGGMRALLWTFRCLQHADSVLGGTLMERTVFVTGSSGGVIGATYYRQLFLGDQEQGTAVRNDAALMDELASDMLNPLAFSFVTNDMFVRYRKVHDGEHSYTLDRGHAFERKLNQNTRGLLDVRLGDLAEAERKARIPILVLSPTVANDGRRLVIGALPMSFLTNILPEEPVHNAAQPESIEFMRLFAEQGAERLKLTSALRMNATFPYITPIVSLPSSPTMRVMDAGVRDNYGYRNTLAFLHTFRHWIAEHTSGVVVLQLRDTRRELEIHPGHVSLVSRALSPIGSVYNNFVRIQDQDHDLMMQQASGWVDFPLEVVDVQLRHDRDERISLSWHLTALERLRVSRSLNTQHNQAAFLRLEELVLGAAGPALVSGESAPGLAADLAARP